MKIDISDLLADPILRFQRDHYVILMTLLCFILPTIIPALWGESYSNAWFVPACFRFIFMLHISWCTNSVAHMVGHKPYDMSSSSTQNLTVSVLSLGEGRKKDENVKINSKRSYQRLAQLPSLVSMGLQDSRAGSLESQLHHFISGCHGSNRMGLRSKDCVNRHDKTSDRKDWRWN